MIFLIYRQIKARSELIEIKFERIKKRKSKREKEWNINNLIHFIYKLVYLTNFCLKIFIFVN